MWTKKYLFEHGHQQGKTLYCGSFTFYLARCSKKQNVAQNVAWLWQTNVTTQHRRFFVATSMQQNEHDHFVTSMLQHVAWPCNMGGWQTDATFYGTLLHQMLHQMLYSFDQRVILATSQFPNLSLLGIDWNFVDIKPLINITQLPLQTFN